MIWQPFKLVSSSRLVASSWQLLSTVIAKEFGPGCGAVLRRQAAWRPRCNLVGVVKFGGTAQAIAVLGYCSNWA